jgi:hypothetical protein
MNLFNFGNQETNDEFYKIESDIVVEEDSGNQVEEEVEEEVVAETEVEVDAPAEEVVAEEDAPVEVEEDAEEEDDDISFFDKDENTIYSISINDVPYFYEDTYEVAVKTMHLTARTLIYKSNSDLEHSIVYRDDYNIDVYKNFLFFRFSAYNIKIDIVRRFNKELLYHA